MSALRKPFASDRYAAFSEPVSPDSKPTLKFIKNVSLGTAGNLLFPVLFPIKQMGKDRFIKDSYFIEFGGRPIEGTRDSLLANSAGYQSLNPEQKKIYEAV